MQELKIHLRALDADLAAAWRDEFAGIPQVEVSIGDVFADGICADAIVSPANSFGYMDGPAEGADAGQASPALGDGTVVERARVLLVYPPALSEDHA